MPNLYDCKTLSQLWAEYQYGLAGNKPARTFSVAERNVKEIKFRYHWRKKFWNAMAQLVRHTNAELAIERLGQVYGVNQPGSLSGFCKRGGRKAECLRSRHTPSPSFSCMSCCITAVYFHNMTQIS